MTAVPENLSPDLYKFHKQSPKGTLYAEPSCSPCTGLSELSISKMVRRCDVLSIANPNFY
jgi:hypothetical protein